MLAVGCFLRVVLLLIIFCVLCMHNKQFKLGIQMVTTCYNRRKNLSSRIAKVDQIEKNLIFGMSALFIRHALQDLFVSLLHRSDDNLHFSRLSYHEMKVIFYIHLKVWSLTRITYNHVIVMVYSSFVFTTVSCKTMLSDEAYCKNCVNSFEC